jgi:hypothetical protein
MFLNIRFSPEQRPVKFKTWEQQVIQDMKAKIHCITEENE